MEGKQFAREFKPTFSASKLNEICSPKSSESTKIKFLANWQPFSDLARQWKKSSEPSTQKSARILLSEREKTEIKKSLDESLNLDELKFDDEKLIASFSEKLKMESGKNESKNIETLEFLMSHLLVTDDDEGSDEYVTAESDEERFRRMNSDRNGWWSVVDAKSKQAVRYISNMRGRKMERSIVEKINQDGGFKFEQNKSRKVVDYGNFKIVGIIDGWCVEQRTILEIKTRKNFEPVKTSITGREKLQAIAYMNMYDCDRCLFVENGPNGELKKTWIDYDENVFRNDIFLKLDEFILFARDLGEEEFKNLLRKYIIY